MAKAKLRTVGCVMEYDGRFLILHRKESRPDGNTWGLPAGKVRKHETDIDAVIREIQEETGYSPEKQELNFLGQFDFEFKDLYLEFPTFHLELQSEISVNHRPDEHSGWKWVTASECYAMKDLIRGFHELLEKTGYIVK